MNPLSPAQALLLLIEKYSDHPELQARLKTLYVLGVRNESDRTEFYTYMQDPALSGWTISYEESVISEDPVKRYFESHLAFSLLELTCPQLTEKVNEMPVLLFSKIPLDSLCTSIINLINGNRAPNVKFEAEYQDLWNRLKNPQDTYLNSQALSRDARLKLSCLARAAFLSCMLTMIWDEHLPLNIYREGYYAPEKRGLIALPKQFTEGGSHSKGLMKKNMRLPRNDILLQEAPYGYLRSVDGSTFNIETEWVRNNFARLTHPFSCSISGTMLCQLRLLKALAPEKVFFGTSQELQAYLVCLSSLLLIHSGGHTFFEFLSPLSLPKVQEAFEFVPGFETLNFDTIMSDPAYQEAINDSLQKAIAYQKHLLLLDKLHTELEEASTSILDGSFFRRNAPETSSTVISATGASPS